jgi:hypothetical protein
MSAIILLCIPPGLQDTSDAAHIHDTAAAGKQLVSEHHLGLPSHDGMLTTAGRAQPLALATTAAATASDEGIVDLEAYTDYAGASSSSSSSSSSEFLDGGDADAEQEQQQLGQQVTQGKDAALQQAARGSEQLRAGWMTSDLSVLLAGNYKAYMEAVVLAAQLCNVTAAAALSDAGSSCRVLYNSAAYLSTIAHRLNIPVEVAHGAQYCYPLPTAAGAAARQHCQVSNKAGWRPVVCITNVTYIWQLVLQGCSAGSCTCNWTRHWLLLHLMLAPAPAPAAVAAAAELHA